MEYFILFKFLYVVLYKAVCSHKNHLKNDTSFIKSKYRSRADVVDF